MHPCLDAHDGYAVTVSPHDFFTNVPGCPEGWTLIKPDSPFCGKRSAFWVPYNKLETNRGVVKPGEPRPLNTYKIVLGVLEIFLTFQKVYWKSKFLESSCID